MNLLEGTLPSLHAAHPIWYRGQLAAVTVDEEVYSVGWADPADRLVLRAMALGLQDAPYFTAEQQLSFAAYYLLPEERWCDLALMTDELISRTTGLPLDLIHRRRELPPLGFECPDRAEAAACA